MVSNARDFISESKFNSLECNNNNFLENNQKVVKIRGAGSKYKIVNEIFRIT
jgi:hypothetical protein